MDDELNVGSPAPDFKLFAHNGREIGLSDYRDKALVVLFFVREYY
jgi:peroxiredoxin